MLFGDLRTTESTKVSVAQKLFDALDGKEAIGSNSEAKKEESKLNSPIKQVKGTSQTQLNVGQRKTQKSPTLIEVKTEKREASKRKARPTFCHKQSARNAVIEVSSKLLEHVTAPIFCEPLDPTHPLFDKLKQHFSTLPYLDNKLRMGGVYVDSNSFSRAIRNMINVKLKLTLFDEKLSGEEFVARQRQIHEFKSHFDRVFTGLEDLVLQEPIDERPTEAAITRVNRALREK